MEFDDHKSESTCTSLPDQAQLGSEAMIKIIYMNIGDWLRLKPIMLP